MKALYFGFKYGFKGAVVISESLLFSLGYGIGLVCHKFFNSSIVDLKLACALSGAKLRLKEREENLKEHELRVKEYEDQKRNYKNK
jgi:hypothetical protein